MNVLKTGILLTALTLLLVWIGQLLGGPQGAMMAFVFALVMNFVSYWFSDKIVLASYRAQPLAESEAPQVYRVVREIAARTHIPMPKIYLVTTPTPNAFATGRSPQHAAVAVTSGLLEILSEEELKGVIAHELSHVRNRDTLTMTVAAALAGAITMLANWLRWGMMFGGGRDRDDREGGGAMGAIAMIAIIILAPLAAMLVQLAVSRTREYEADESGARMAGTPQGLAGALEKIEASVRALPMQANPATAHLFIVNPLRGDMIAQLFSTHPPTAERVRRLRHMHL